MEVDKNNWTRMTIVLPPRHERGLNYLVNTDEYDNKTSAIREAIKQLLKAHGVWEELK